jgi:mutator protein MutT
MKYRIIVSAVIFNQGKILLGKKEKDRGPYPNTWHIPGGGVELEKETCDEAVIREIKEETGLGVKNLEKIHWDTGMEPNKHGEITYYVFLVYKCEYEKGDLIASDDLEHLEWVDVKNLNDYALSKPTVLLFKKINLF